MSTNTADWFSPTTTAGENKSIISSTTTGSSARVNLDRGAFGSVSVSVVVTKDGHWRCSAIKSIIQPNNNNTNNTANKFRLGGPTTTTSVALSPEIFQEVCALRLLNPHPNIIPLYSLALVGENVELTFPYRADLATTLDWRRRALLPRLWHPVVLGIARDLFSALHHCHSRGIVHLDIKPGNLLVDPATGVVQLCDFGLAQSYSLDGNESLSLLEEENQAAAKGLCTLFYRPPEQLFGSNATSPSFDIYSAGLVLVELMAGFPLFRGTTVIGQLEATFRVMGSPKDETSAASHHLPDFGKLTFAHKPPQKLHSVLPRAEECQFLLPLLERLLAFNAAHRPTAKEVLDNPLFQQTSSNKRRQQQQELVPNCMREPLILSNPDKNMIVATQSLTELVAARGQAAASLNKWQGGKKPFQTCKRSFRHATIYCAKSVTN